MAEKQHRVSKVYLKQFAIRGTGHEKIFAMKKFPGLFLHGVGKQWPVTEEAIKEMTITDGEFDLGSVEPTDRDQLEKFFGKFEHKYTRVLSAIDAKKVSSETSDFLIGFIASLLVRSRAFRNWMAYELSADTSRTFLNTMCMYMSKEEREQRVENIEQFPVKDRLNHACYCIWHNLYYRLGNFRMVFFDNPTRGWETSDDPVVLRNIEARGGTLVGRATELYFPLSKRWCLFMYDPKSKYPLNPMTRWERGSFVLADDWVRFIAREFVFQNADSHIFFSSSEQFSAA